MIKRIWCSLYFHTWSGKSVHESLTLHHSALSSIPFYSISKPHTPLRWTCLSSLIGPCTPQSILGNRLSLALLLFRPPLATFTEIRVGNHFPLTVPTKMEARLDLGTFNPLLSPRVFRSPRFLQWLPSQCVTWTRHLSSRRSLSITSQHHGKVPLHTHPTS